MTDTTRGWLAGSLAGLAATAPMTALMNALHPTLAPDDPQPLPPRQITMQAADSAGVKDDLDEESKTGLTMLAHFGYGTGAGALYGAAAPHLPFTPAVNGIAYGLTVWAGSYMGWLPAARILPPVSEQPAGRTAVMIAAHVAWGATLGVLHDMMIRRRSDPAWSERASANRTTRETADGPA